MTNRDMEGIKYLSVSYFDMRDGIIRRIPTIDVSSQEQMGDLYRTMLELKREERVAEEFVGDMRSRLVNNFRFDVASYYISEQSLDGAVDNIIDKLMGEGEAA